MFSRDQRIGRQAEDWFFNQAMARGYSTQTQNRWEAKNCDLKINGLPIEVKFALPTRRRQKSRYYTRWQWNIHPTAQGMDGDWVLVLIAQDTSGHRSVYIMPGAVLGERTHLQLTSHPDLYTGWISQWRNRWDVIDYLSDEVYRDGGPLFQVWRAVA